MRSCLAQDLAWHTGNAPVLLACLVFVVCFVCVLRGFLVMCWVFAVACRLSLVVANRGFSRCGTQALEYLGSVVVAHGLSCPKACGILTPRPGIKPESPAFEGGF